MKKNEKNEKSKIWLFLFAAFAVMFVVGGISTVTGALNRKKANDAYGQMQTAVNDVQSQEDDILVGGTEVEWEDKAKGVLPNGSGEKPESSEKGGLETGMEEDGALIEVKIKKEKAKPSPKPGETVSGKKLDWDALRKECADIYAWISVPGTTVDYPIVQHPTSNAYYLNHNMDGSKGYPGCIYTENYNKKDFSDLHTVIYGHNLKDKTMFSTLHNFEKKKLVTEPHYIYVYTEEDVFTYEIFAVYEYPAIHLLANYDLTNEYVYEQYIKDIFNMDNTDARIANIRHDIEVTNEDKIITLSTCTSDHDASLRFLVVGVLQNS